MRTSNKMRRVVLFFLFCGASVCLLSALQEEKNAPESSFPQPQLLDINISRQAIPIELALTSSGEVYPGHGVENSLDGEPNDDYTAFYENSQHQFTVELTPAVNTLSGILTFLDSTNYASDWKVEALDQDKQLRATFQKKAATTQKQTFQLSAEKPISYLRFSFSGFVGQQRLLLRQFQILPALNESSEINLIYYLGGEFLCKELHLDFSNWLYIPENINAWMTDNKRTAKHGNLFSIINNNTELTVPVNKDFAFMILSLSSFTQNPVAPENPELQPVIDFSLDEQQQKDYLRDLELHKKILIAGNDQRNPLFASRWPITEYYRHMATQLLGPEADRLSNFQKVIILMDYICHLNYLPPRDVTPFGVLHEKMGECSSFAATLMALAGSYGIKGRYVNLNNYPENNGHTVAEIFIDGKWMIFDPTYGLYFKDAKTGEIMSFEELRDPANKAVPVYLNKERYQRSGQTWGTQAVYLHANPAGPIGPDRPMFYPLKFDLNGRSSLEPSDFAYQGSVYIGAALTNNNHLWTLSGLTPGKEYEFILTPRYIGGDLGEDEFEFKCRILEDGEKQGKSLDFKVNRAELNPIKISFTASAPEMKLEFTHPYRGPEFHYLTIRRFELVETQPTISERKEEGE